MSISPAALPIFGESLDSLIERLKEHGHPAYRARQILKWVYRQRVTHWEDMTNLPPDLRTWLAQTFDLTPVRLALAKCSSDVTDKLLLEMRDRAMVETVIIRAPQEGVGPERSRKTICISTQVGCAYGCVFCASGLAGWKRDLSAGEIVGQLMQVEALSPERRSRATNKLASFDNIVVMGMGEPLANYDNLLRALRIVHAPWGLGFGARRITVSTSGLVPEIRRLAADSLNLRLAISLHGATNEVREQIMPINRRYPLEKLLPAVREFTQQRGRMITLEFILIRDVNDSLEQARRLGDIARDLHAHVNLIPYNDVAGLPWKRPNVKRQDTFAQVLRATGASVTIRREKGHEIAAACGQLRLKVERDGGIEDAPVKGKGSRR